MDEIYVEYRESYPHLEEALKDGAKMHVFLSGGGLRVVGLEKKKDSKEDIGHEEDEHLSYGEFPYFSGALSHAEEDFGLSYSEQYGKKHVHYLTGAYPMPFDVIDVYLKAGGSFVVVYSKRWEKFICTTPAPRSLQRNNEVLWGTGINILSAICSCLISFQFEDEDELMKRVFL